MKEDYEGCVQFVIKIVIIFFWLIYAYIIGSKPNGVEKSILITAQVFKKVI